MIEIVERGKKHRLVWFIPWVGEAMSVVLQGAKAASTALLGMGIVAIFVFATNITN